MSDDKKHGSGDGDEVLWDPGKMAGSDDGVDGTLIRWMLGMTPAQRLATLQSHVDAVLGIRDGNAAT
ncbi:MAG: hypothetical protein A2Y95_02145 [Deltaproteobacteria bacterium RBG_13_65_10]|nr:MAG: hypothetical protein A2Y95_02145 [Deltaproteobacteria bacterium RBG_13_65_10]